MQLKEKIREFIKSIENDEGMLPYLYNKKMKEFDPQKSWVYYSGPVWDIEEPLAAIETFLTGRWLPSGDQVARFEREFNKKYNFKSSLMVNSGSSANLIAISALKKHLNWKDGAKVIVSPVGFPTTIAPLVQNNLIPTFIDINFNDLNFNLDSVADNIDDDTVAVFASPVLGNSFDMDQLKEICDSKNIHLILDGCDSLGSKWNGRDLSDYAYLTTCSFYPAHHITTGEGGMVSSNDEELIATARSFAWWGRDCYCVGATNLSAKGACGNRFSKWLDGYEGPIDHKYLFSNIGYNVKPLDLQGALGLAQLKKENDIHRKRRAHKKRIHEIVNRTLGDAVHIPSEGDKGETSWFGVPFICQKNKMKAELVQFLEDNRIQTRNYFAGNILMHPAYSKLDDMAKFPNANQVLDRVFFIGCHPSYTDDVFDYMEKVFGEFRQQFGHFFNS